MKKLSQAAKVAAFLQSNPQKKFTAREIAEGITVQYASDYQNKKTKYVDERVFIQQIVAEIGAQKDSIIKICPEIEI